MRHATHCIPSAARSSNLRYLKKSRTCGAWRGCLILTNAWEADLETGRGLCRRLLFGYSAFEFKHAFANSHRVKQFFHFGELEELSRTPLDPFIVSQISAHGRSGEKPAINPMQIPRNQKSSFRLSWRHPQIAVKLRFPACRATICARHVPKSNPPNTELEIAV